MILRNKFKDMFRILIWECQPQCHQIRLWLTIRSEGAPRPVGLPEARLGRQPIIRIRTRLS
jgi:hypothetical protein